MEGDAARLEDAERKREDGFRGGEACALGGMDGDRPGRPFERCDGREQQDACSCLFRAAGEIAGDNIVTVDGT